MNIITKGFGDTIITKGYGIVPFYGDLVTADFNIARIKTSDLEL